MPNAVNYGTPLAGRHATRLALACGATKLNCYDGWLVGYYKSLGFEEYDRVAFDESQAPASFPADHLGRPDVVFMRRVAVAPRKPSVHAHTQEVPRG